jgi:hypothetical protein
MDPTASAAGDWAENLNLNPPTDHFSSSKMTKCPQITSGLSIYSIQSMKKSPNRSKAWTGCIR